MHSGLLAVVLGWPTAVFTTRVTALTAELAYLAGSAAAIGTIAALRSSQQSHSR
jgi:hypothetical protein